MDIVPDLLEKIEADYQAKILNDTKLNSIRKKIAEKTATYIEADEYAKRLGEILSAVYDTHLTDEDLPNGKMYYNIAQRILDPTIKKASAEVSEISAKIQGIVNEKHNIGIKPIKVNVNQDRIDGLIDKLSDGANNGK